MPDAMIYDLQNNPPYPCSVPAVEADDVQRLAARVARRIEELESPTGFQVRAGNLWARVDREAVTGPAGIRYGPVVVEVREAGGKARPDLRDIIQLLADDVPQASTGPKR